MTNTTPLKVLDPKTGQLIETYEFIAPPEIYSGKFEKMTHMAARLSGCGAGEKSTAVLKAIELIKDARGCLDLKNQRAALYQLGVALAGEYKAAPAIIDLAEFLNPNPSD